jgi:hypothetical protein
VTNLTLEALRIELAPIKAQIDGLQARLDGLPLISRAIITLQQDTRGLRAAFNDFARTNVTAGEVEALHTDVNRTQADNTALEHRIATLERLVASLTESQQRKG